MSQMDEAVARYNKLLESGPFRDLSWAESLHERMESARLSSGGRLICPFLRPNFISRRQYESLVKMGESLICAIDRMETMVLATPALLSRLELLPAEKMLASIDPGYQALEVAARLDTHLVNGHLHFVQYNADSPTGAAYADALADLFYEIPPMKELRKKYGVTKVGSRKHLLQALLKSYKQFGGAKKKPNIAIVEFRQPYAAQSEYELFRDFSARKGIRSKSFPRNSSSIATAYCAAAPSKSTWCTAGLECRSSCCASTCPIRWCRLTATARFAW